MEYTYKMVYLLALTIDCILSLSLIFSILTKHNSVSLCIFEQCYTAISEPDQQFLQVRAQLLAERSRVYLNVVW